MGLNFSMLPMLVKLEHVFHVGHDHSLHRPGAAETAAAILFMNKGITRVNEYDYSSWTVIMSMISLDPD